MLGEDFLDAFAVLVQLRFERAELLGAGDGQQAFCRGDGGVGAGRLGGDSEKGDAFGRGFRAVELVGVEELFPLAFAGAGEVVRGGEGQRDWVSWQSFGTNGQCGDINGASL